MLPPYGYENIKDKVATPSSSAMKPSNPLWQSSLASLVVAREETILFLSKVILFSSLGLLLYNYSLFLLDTQFLLLYFFPKPPWSLIHSTFQIST
jgi:hypothetical protein